MEKLLAPFIIIAIFIFPANLVFASQLNSRALGSQQPRNPTEVYRSTQPSLTAQRNFSSTVLSDPIPRATKTGRLSEDSVNASIPELSWTSGEPFPIVNGHIIFPTLAPSLSPPTSYSTHWYAGSVYPFLSPTQNAGSIAMTIMVPYSAPRSDEFYYVILSAWDSNGSYDQIGFSDNWGTWGLTYSWTTGPPSNPTYHYSPDAMDLSLGVTYTFIISTTSGVTHFVVYQGSTQVWSLDAPTGGNYLVLSYIYSGYYDYTDYEEVWYTSTSGGSPAFNFYFYNNYWISTSGVSNAATWNTFSSSAPSNVAVVISGNSVLVHNPMATILFKTNPTSFVSSSGNITFSGSTYSNGQTNSFLDGDYTAAGNAPTDYQFFFWEYSGSSGSGVYVSNIGVNPTTVKVQGDGWLKVVFSAKITFHTNPSSGGSITWGSSGPSYTDGQTQWEANLPPDYSNTVTITANPPSGYTFSSWSTSGMLSITSSSSNPTTLTVNGPGTLTANFVPSPVSLNLRTVDWSGNVLPLCNVTVAGVGSKISSSTGWANFTNVPSGTYGISVIWQGSKVNQTSVSIATSNVTTNVKCHVWSLTVNAKDNGSTLLQPNNMQTYVTFPNGTHVNPTNVNSETWKVQNGTYYFAVKWQGSWVYGNTSVALDTTTATQDLPCKVYSLSFAFKDNSGTTITPSSWQVKAPNGTVSTLTGSIPQAQNGTWEITQILLNGNDVVPSPHPTYSLASNYAWAVTIQTTAVTTSATSTSTTTSTTSTTTSSTSTTTSSISVTTPIENYMGVEIYSDQYFPFNAIVSGWNHLTAASLQDMLNQIYVWQEAHGVNLIENYGGISIYSDSSSPFNAIVSGWNHLTATSLQDMQHQIDVWQASHYYRGVYIYSDQYFMYNAVLNGWNHITDTTLSGLEHQIDAWANSDHSLP